MARNIYSDGGLNCTGDVMHFSPGRVGYIGRKLELGPDPATGGLRCFPPVLGQGAASFTPDPAALDICWRIVTDLFSGLVAGQGADTLQGGRPAPQISAFVYRYRPALRSGGKCVGALVTARLSA